MGQGASASSTKKFGLDLGKRLVIRHFQVDLQFDFTIVVEETVFLVQREHLDVVRKAGRHRLGERVIELLLYGAGRVHVDQSDFGGDFDGLQFQFRLNKNV